jgi:hypothetical protein
MNWLQMVQRLRSEAGVSGADPVSCQNQTGEMLRLVRWINDAWLDIQNVHADWFFLRGSFAFNTNTVTAQQSYTPLQCNAANFGNWKRDSMRIYSVGLGVSNEMILPYIGWDEFRNLYLYGNMRLTLQRPVLYTIDPQKNFVLGATPDASGYTVDGEYYAVASYMVNDTDIPVMPVQYHMAIVWRALLAYGLYEGASEAVDRGASEFKTLMARMQQDQLPTMTFGAPLC